MAMSFSAGPMRAAGLALVAALFLGPACRRAPERPNLVLITLDTTRADRLGCYGYTNGLTPALDALASNGVLFERAYTTVPMTLPAHATILTGLHPAEHGLRVTSSGRLDRRIPTLAEQCAALGYTNAAFIAACVLDARYGLDRGFHVYDGGAIAGDDPRDDRTLEAYRPGNEVMDAALAWLGNATAGGRRPFFLWVHLYDPHTPNALHRAVFGDRFSDAYDAEIAFMDRQIGRLVESLRAGGGLSRTWIVAVGDHGEGLGEHGEATHGLTLYEGVMRVPLLVVPPAGRGGGRRAEFTVSLVDLLPTLQDLLGAGSGGADRSRSFAAAVRGEPMASRSWYGETLLPATHYGCAPLQCRAEQEWKYIRSRVPELYHTDRDPWETNNLAAAEPERCQRMEDDLRQVEAQFRPPAVSPAVRLDAADQRRLHSLGYAAGGRGTTALLTAATSGRDVKELLHASNLFWLIERRLAERDDGEGVRRLCEELTGLCPDDPGVQRQRERLLGARGE